MDKDDKLIWEAHEEDDFFDYVNPAELISKLIYQDIHNIKDDELMELTE